MSDSMLCSYVDDKRKPKEADRKIRILTRRNRLIDTFEQRRRDSHPSRTVPNGWRHGDMATWRLRLLRCIPFEPQLVMCACAGL